MYLYSVTHILFSQDTPGSVLAAETVVQYSLSHILFSPYF
jgi:hypothetical protein